MYFGNAGNKAAPELRNTSTLKALNRRNSSYMCRHFLSIPKASEHLYLTCLLLTSTVQNSVSGCSKCSEEMQRPRSRYMKGLQVSMFPVLTSCLLIPANKTDFLTQFRMSHIVFCSMMTYPFCMESILQHMRQQSLSPTSSYGCRKSLEYHKTPPLKKLQMGSTK